MGCGWGMGQLFVFSIFNPRLDRRCSYLYISINSAILYTLVCSHILCSSLNLNESKILALNEGIKTCSGLLNKTKVGFLSLAMEEKIQGQLNLSLAPAVAKITLIFCPREPWLQQPH